MITRSSQHFGLWSLLLVAWFPVTNSWTTPRTASRSNSVVSSNTPYFVSQRPIASSLYASGASDRDSNNEDPASSSSSSSNNHKRVSVNNNNQTMSSEQQHKQHDTAKKIRLQKAQAEMDRILASPDAPVDLEHELKKVVMMAPPQAPQSEQADQLDAHESHLEQTLYQAAKRQDFDKAASIQREISQLHIDDCGAVLYANAQFYKAFTNQDYAHMATLWTRDGTATCIHPACQALIGTKSIMASWQTLFTNPTNQRTMLEPQKIRVAVKGAAMAIVSCEEHVYTRRFIQGQKRQTELVNKLVATNIFRKVNGRWLLHHHHASWHVESNASQMGLKGLGFGNGKPSRRGIADTTIKSADANIMNGILGGPNLGPLLSSGVKKQPTKRIVAMGSLNDLLNGNLGGFLGKDSAEDDDDDDEEEGNGKLPKFIHIARDDDDDVEDVDDELHLLDDDDDEDEDEEEDDEDDEDYDNEPERVIIKRYTRGKSTSAAKQKKAESNNMVTGAPKDALRQSCIAALRKLCDQGAISPKQKRVLLTDIISCSKKGDFSMVEVAYELLCGESEDKDVAEEEFADQCRVLAQSLPDPLAPSLKFEQ